MKTRITTRVPARTRAMVDTLTHAVTHTLPFAVLAGAVILERLSVPGWVLITVMTVALVGLLWAVAKEQILELFKNALNKAKGI
jgi:nitrogen fixation-related uncharacterized protein